MTNDCEGCGRPTADGATICTTCGQRLDAAIADVCAYQGLAYDLDIALTRQSRMGSRDGSRPTEAAVPFDSRAGLAARKLRTVLNRWARVVHTDTDRRPTGPTCTRCEHHSCAAIRRWQYPPDELAAVAAWLRPRVGWLRHHVDGGDAHDQILDAVKYARKVCDRPAGKIYAGPCDECGEDLYADLEARYVICANPVHEDELVWPVEERRRWLLQSAEDVLATATEISRALTRYAQPVTPSALRGYVHRGQLISRGERAEGKRMVMLYRLGDVLDILARQAERVSA